MRISSKTKVIIHDVSASAAAWVLALYARFNFEHPPEVFFKSCMFVLPIVMVVQGTILNLFKLYDIYKSFIYKGAVSRFRGVINPEPTSGVYGG